MLGLCRKISAGKSCMMTSHRSSHVVRTKLGLPLRKELFTHTHTRQVLNQFYTHPPPFFFTTYSNGLNNNYGRPKTTNLPLTSHWMREYACRCLSASARGTLKTSGISQTRALRRMYHVNSCLKTKKKKKERRRRWLFETPVPAILWGGTSAWLGSPLWK